MSKKEAEETQKPNYEPEIKWAMSEADPPVRAPYEVFRAIEGERKQLAEYLRRGRPPSIYTMDAIAAWMAGELPPHRGRGRPPATYMNKLSKIIALAIAESDYKKKFEAAGRPYGEASAISYAVAKKHNIDPDKFADFQRRAKSQRPKDPEILPLLEEMWWEWKAGQKKPNSKTKS